MQGSRFREYLGEAVGASCEDRPDRCPRFCGALIAIDRGERRICAVVEHLVSRRKMRVAPIGNASAWSGSAPSALETVVAGFITKPRSLIVVGDLAQSALQCTDVVSGEPSASLIDLIDIRSIMCYGLRMIAI